MDWATEATNQASKDLQRWSGMCIIEDQSSLPGITYEHYKAYGDWYFFVVLHCKCSPFIFTDLRINYDIVLSIQVIAMTVNAELAIS